MGGLESNASGPEDSRSRIEKLVQELGAETESLFGQCPILADPDFLKKYSQIYGVVLDSFAALRDRERPELCRKQGVILTSEYVDEMYGALGVKSTAEFVTLLAKNNKRAISAYRKTKKIFDFSEILSFSFTAYVVASIQGILYMGKNEKLARKKTQREEAVTLVSFTPERGVDLIRIVKETHQNCNLQRSDTQYGDRYAVRSIFVNYLTGKEK